MGFIFGNWNWYIAGPLIGLFVPLTLIIGNKMFGISSALVHICTVVMPKEKIKTLKYNWEENSWKLYFVIGIVIGAFIATNYLSEQPQKILPEMYYSFPGYIKLFIGGVLVGFGTRYANGCTSGHAITGLSLSQSSSLKATISFFIGGLIFTFVSYYL
jgi:hypothetical protein